MEAPIQCGSYFPAYFSTNPNLSANGNKRNHYLSSDHLFGYYKEAFKQTIINQEMQFKDQIQDLHRLYGRQRELMDEMGRNQLDKHNLNMDVSRPTPSLPPPALICTKKTVHTPFLPLVNSACSQVSVSGAVNDESLSYFVPRMNIKTFSNLAQNEGNEGKCDLLEFKCNKSRKNMWDLRLPGDVIYIDSEDEGLLEHRKVSEAHEVSNYHFLKRIPEVPEVSNYHYLKRIPEVPEVMWNGDAKQCLGNNRFNSVSDPGTSSAASLEKASVDLNDMCKLEEERAPSSRNFGGPTSLGENPCAKDLLQKTKSYCQVLSKEFSPGTQSRQDFEAYSNVLLQESESKQDCRLSCYDMAGKRRNNFNSFPQGFWSDNLSPISNSLHVELKQADEPPTVHEINQYSERTVVDNLIRIDGLLAEHHGITKYLHNSANVNALKDIDLNFMPPSCSMDVPNSKSFQTTGAQKLEDSNERFPLYGSRPVYNRKTDTWCENSNQAEASDFSSKRIDESPTFETPNISGDKSYHVSNSDAPQNPLKSNQRVLVDLNVACDSLLSKEIDLTTDEHLVGSELKTGVGFEVHIDLNSSVNEDGFSSMFSPSAEFEAPASPENKECSPPRGVSSDENQADTPSLMIGQEDLENKERSSSSDENQVNTPVPVQEDLEYKQCPQTIESDENQIARHIPLSGQENEVNKDFYQPMESDKKQIKTPIFSGKEVHQEDELFRTAAECLASISSSKFHTCSRRNTFQQFIASCDTLHWFAGLASSVLGSPENKLDSCDNDKVLPDGMDYFEVMTLKLAETKVEECCLYKTESNGHKEEVMRATTSQSQPRKGRKRQGRLRRKDFQSDILPGLTSLSRYEVIEDLQVIGTLMEASAGCCETTSVRHAAKFGLARGRRRCSISAETENTSKSQLKHISVKRQFGNEEKSVIDWGAVTKRRRGPRNPVSNSRMMILW